jgi:hypothetical protein
MFQSKFAKGDWAFTVNAPESADALPQATRDYLIAYGWKQSLSDAYAGAKDQSEFEGKLLKRFDALMNGTMRLGEASGRAAPTRDPVEKEFRRLVAEHLAAWVKSRKQKPSADLQQVWLDRFLEVNGEAVRATAEENVARKRAMVIADIDLPEESEAEGPDGTPTFE